MILHVRVATAIAIDSGVIDIHVIGTGLVLFHSKPVVNIFCTGFDKFRNLFFFL